MHNPQIKMVATDLDGTLFRKNEVVSNTDLNTFKRLGNRKIVRVAATGRSLYSAFDALPSDFPIDYLVFSTGAGVMNWKSKEIISTKHLHAKEVERVSQMLYNQNITFSIHPPIPDTHKFIYWENNEEGLDMKVLKERYGQFLQAFDPLNFEYQSATEIRAIIPNDEELCNKISAQCNGSRAIRATSPLNKDFLWLEVFHSEVSKANGINHICILENIRAEEILCIGNDYNDIEMLDFAGKSYVVANAPKELIDRYNHNFKAKSNLENGVSDIVMSYEL